MLKAKLLKTVDEAANIRTFYFSCDPKPRFIAGQFIEMYLPHENADDRGHRRWFTLSSSPTEESLAITTKFSGQSSSTFNKFLFGLTIGDEVEIVPPMGDFVLPKSKDIPIIFVAGGIGITPVRSIIKYLQDTPSEKREITLLYSVSSEDQLVFSDIFKKSDIQYIPIINERLTADKIVQLTNPTDNHYIYLSGPEIMVESLWKDLQKVWGHKANIYTDFFPGYTL